MSAPAEIRVDGLRAFGRHGVFEHERRAGQEFVVDALLRLDPLAASAAARDDDLSFTVDYGALCTALVAVVTGEPVALLETLASRLLEVCLADPRVIEAEVTVHKPSAPLPVESGEVSVTLRRPQAAVLALGSNLGDRAAHLERGITHLAGELLVFAVSPVYEAEPVGGPPQPAYLNAVALVAPAPAGRLLSAARNAERDAGRVRTQRWAPRTLDVDVIHLPGVVSADPQVTLPHPRAHERAFVLAPWLDLDPGAALPGRGRVADLLKDLGSSGLRRRDDVVLP